MTNSITTSMTSSIKKSAANFLLASALLLVALIPNLHGETKEIKTAAFQIQQEVVIAAKPEAVYDAATGDISGWWDHHMSEHPKKLYIEAKPGGCFCEIFDDAGKRRPTRRRNLRRSWQNAPLHWTSRFFRHGNRQRNDLRISARSRRHEAPGHRKHHRPDRRANGTTG